MWSAFVAKVYLVIYVSRDIIGQVGRNIVKEMEE